MSVICALALMIGSTETHTYVIGTIIGTTDDSYGVDFSKEAVKKGIEEDYSKVIVNKKDCVELK